MNDRVLELVDKAGRIESNKRFCRLAYANGIRLRINIIPDLPTTTYGEALRALEHFTEIAECLDRVDIYPFEPTKSSALGRSPSRYGLKLVAADDGQGQAQYPSNHLTAEDGAMTRSERVSVRAAFDDFARRVSRRRVSGTRRQRCEISDSVDLVLSYHSLDIVPWTGGGFSVFDFRNRRLTQVGREYAIVFDLLRQRGSLTLGEIGAAVDDPIKSAACVSNLIRSELLSLEVDTTEGS
jgi:hypothetical protein